LRTEAPAPKGRSPVLRTVLAALLLRPFCRWVVGVEVRGAGNLPERDPFLLVANHDSHLDTLILLSLFPLRRLGRIRPVAAADYWLSSAPKRFVARTCLNVLPVVRGGASAEEDPLAPLSAALSRGESLILFPEGTRGEPEVLERFRTGAARLALENPGVPVVPVYLANTGRNLPRGTTLFVPFVVKVAVGPAIQLPPEVRAATACLEDAVRSLADDASRGVRDTTVT
jgi:1-acyl-sn-glycerol-3-phosphate acyltransferase